MPYPLSCKICNDKGLSRRIVQSEISLQAKPVRGSRPFVMLVGQDPTLSQGIARTVLTLGKEDERTEQRDWILGELMQPAGLQLRDIYATNLVKCTFPGNRTPSHIAHDLNKKTFEVLAPFFGFCRGHFISEIDMIKPKIVISLGKTVHQLMVGGLKWDVQVDIARAFGNKFSVSVEDHQFLYFPCITHKTWDASVNRESPRDDVYRTLWPQFINMLKEEVERQRAMMPQALPPL